jgi:SAM-dependent methyltransferase
LNIDIRDLLNSIPFLQVWKIPIGFPDDPTPVTISDPKQFSKCLDSALFAFSCLRPENPMIVEARVNGYHNEVWIRFVGTGSRQDAEGKREAALDLPFRTLQKRMVREGGKLHYWGGNNYFDISLPFRGPMREEFPDLKHLPWDARYQHLLERATWSYLRSMVFRFANLAESFGNRCVEHQQRKILIPSVGICIHPWIFANQGLSVTATDLAGTALSVVSEPDQWLRLFSRTAYERWDISQSAMYAEIPQPHHFSQMPSLEDRFIREALRKQITFTQADWMTLPIESNSIDAIFATNALPRESQEDQQKVFQEWGRVLRPGGRVFIVQHNSFNMDEESLAEQQGWIATNILRGDRPADLSKTAYQYWHSSG